MIKKFSIFPPKGSLQRKFVTLHIPILVSLFILTDNETHNDQSDETASNRHLALFTALARHPPSMRVFRGAFAISLLGFCCSFLLFQMQAIFGNEMLNHLFFTPPYTLVDIDGNQTKASRGGEYELANTEDFDDEEKDKDENEDGENLNKKIECDIKEDGMNQQISRKSPNPAFIIANVSLDLLFMSLVTLFLFTISSSAGGQYIDQTNVMSESNGILAEIGSIASPTFPLILFFVCMILSFFPWTKRRQYLWMVISYTIGAPYYDVTFRDGFIGDIFTSMVRPIQDVAFTTFYFCSGLQGWWIYHKTDEDRINQPVETSWLLHTVVLPACTVSPLWWRFCQCLRQTYDTRERWPYLGNAAKYFIAAQVAMFGTFDPAKRGSVLWILAFVGATLYQLWWDIFMDWELLHWVPSANDLFGGSYQLRSERYYKYKSFYIFIFIINTILRFFWTLTVLPSRYLSPSGALLDNFSTDISTFIIPILTCAEIIRRSLWGFIRVELEVLKISKKEKQSEYELETTTNVKALEKGLEPMSIDANVTGTGHGAVTFSSNLDASTSVTLEMSSGEDGAKLLVELCVYAAVFTGMGIMAAVHRQVL